MLLLGPGPHRAKLTPISNMFEFPEAVSLVMLFGPEKICAD
jgi:hypothetical protein